MRAFSLLPTLVALLSASLFLCALLSLSGRRLSLARSRSEALERKISESAEKAEEGWFNVAR